MNRNRNALSVLRRVAMSVISCTLLAMTPAWAQGVSDRGCYGDTIEVVLVNQMTGEPKVPMSIPLDAFPVIYGFPDLPNGAAPDPSQACMPEPVLAKSVYFYPNSKPSAVLGIPDSGPLVRRFEIYYAGKEWGEARHYRDQEQRFKKYLADGKSVVLPNGFTKLFPTPSFGGEYRAPMHYREPAGKPLQFGCNPMPSGSAECHINYSSSEEIAVDYSFMTDAVDPNRWIELDQMMRRLVLRFIDSSYLQNFK